MTTYHADMTSCDHYEFSGTVEADSLEEAWGLFEDLWEDARIHKVYTEQDRIRWEQERYQRLEREMDWG